MGKSHIPEEQLDLILNAPMDAEEKLQELNEWERWHWERTPGHRRALNPWLPCLHRGCGKPTLGDPSASVYCPEHQRSEVRCCVCGVELRRIPSRVKKRSYCSEHNPSKRNRVIVQCDTCGAELERRRSVVRERNYCDTTCRSTSPEAREKLSIAASKRLAENRNFRSRIEYELADLLTSWGFREGSDFIAQKHFHSRKDYPEGRFGMNCDFFFPRFNLVVEMNGTYFHADPTLYPNRGALDRHQLKNVARYERKVRWLHSKGYRLVEVWERENAFAEAKVIAPLLLLTVCQAVADEEGC